MLALYTLVVDRLEYTQRIIDDLENKNNQDFVHFILSQGSSKETDSWLKSYTFKHDTHIYKWDNNRGISIGSNFLIERISEADHENHYHINVISKIDNDIETITPNWLDRCYNVAKNYSILCSPMVKGLVTFPDGVPGYITQVISGENIRLTKHIGGIVHMAKAGLHLGHTYPEDMTYGLDQDVTLTRHANNNFYLIGYLEDVHIQHSTTIQKEKYPEYFKVKETIWERESPNGK